MKIKLSRKEETILSLVIAIVFGLVWGSVFPFGSSYGGELAVVRNDLTIERRQVVSAQSLKEGNATSYIFPPPLYVFEWIEFNVHVYNASGGALEINFTRDGKILRTDLVQGSEKIVLSGYGEYRLQQSSMDVTLQALDEDVRIRSIYIVTNHGSNQYNPLVSALSYVLLVAIIIVIPRIHRSLQKEKEMPHE
jgi:hypothetical protein